MGRGQTNISWPFSKFSKRSVKKDILQNPNYYRLQFQLGTALLQESASTGTQTPLDRAIKVFEELLETCETGLSSRVFKSKKPQIKRICHFVSSNVKPATEVLLETAYCLRDASRKPDAELIEMTKEKCYSREYNRRVLYEIARLQAVGYKPGNRTQAAEVLGNLRGSFSAFASTDFSPGILASGALTDPLLSAVREDPEVKASFVEACEAGGGTLNPISDSTMDEVSKTLQDLGLVPPNIGLKA